MAAMATAPSRGDEGEFELLVKPAPAPPHLRFGGGAAVPARAEKLEGGHGKHARAMADGEHDGEVGFNCRPVGPCLLGCAGLVARARFYAGAGEGGANLRPYSERVL